MSDAHPLMTALDGKLNDMAQTDLEPIMLLMGEAHRVQLRKELRWLLTRNATGRLRDQRSSARGTALESYGGVPIAFVLERGQVRLYVRDIRRPETYCMFVEFDPGSEGETDGS